MDNFHIDVIAMNPPYQLNDGGGTGDSAKPIYNKFIENAISLNPKYIVSINPSRWFKGGKGLDKFRLNMINDTRIKEIHDFENASECFPNVHIDGGINYFLWDRDYDGMVHFVYKPENGKSVVSDRFLKTDYSDTIVRDYRQLSIIAKAKSFKEDTFDSIVSARKPYGIATDLFNVPENYVDFDLHKEVVEGYLKIYGVKGNKGGAKRTIGYVKKSAPSQDIESIDKYKLFFSYAYSTNTTVPPKIIVGYPNEISTETFLRVGTFGSENEALNCLSYMKTKFFRALLFFNRIQKNSSRKTFNLIPIQDFSKQWTDKELYDKYNLTEDEINFIESNIKEMK